MAKALANNGPDSAAQRSISNSPGKTVEVRGKYLEQLRYIQQLYKDDILDATEYAELKDNILGALRKL